MLEAWSGLLVGIPAPKFISEIGYIVLGLFLYLLMERLNSALLFNLYVDWTKRWGNGRNDNDIRFGQWVWNHWYDHLKACKEGVADPAKLLDGFYTESAHTALNQINSLLAQENRSKNS